MRQIAVEPGLAGAGKQAHARFFGRAAAFAVVAVLTGRDQVFPGVSAAAVAGQDVVDGEFSRMHAAVLAGVAVTAKHFLAHQAGPGGRPLDQVVQLDD